PRPRKERARCSPPRWLRAAPRARPDGRSTESASRTAGRRRDRGSARRPPSRRARRGSPETGTARRSGSRDRGRGARAPRGSRARRARAARAGSSVPGRLPGAEWHVARALPRALARILALDDFEEPARRYLPRPMFGYVSGGAETNASLSANRAQFDEIELSPRVLVDVSGRTAKTALFGRAYGAPFGIAPMGG